MRITVTGKHAGRPGITVSYDGELSGDVFATADIAALIERGRSVSQAGIGGGVAALDFDDVIVTVLTMTEPFRAVQNVHADGIDLDAFFHPGRDNPNTVY